MARKNITDLSLLFIEDVSRHYDMESQLVEALGEMAGLASDKQLKKMFLDHQQETREQKKRLERIARSLETELGRVSSAVTASLIKEVEMAVRQTEDPAIRDVILVLGAIKVEHYEMACYGGAIVTAGRLKLKEEKKLLRESQREEKMSARKMELAIRLLIRVVPSDI